jgi:hypothetical protein
MDPRSFFFMFLCGESAIQVLDGFAEPWADIGEDANWLWWLWTWVAVEEAI